MATSDEQARAAAAQIDFEMKFYVGGKWTDADLDNIEAGQPYTPTISTTLAEDVDEDETDITVVNASGLTTGVVVLVPGAAPQVYELVKYGSITSNTLNDCVRTVLGSQVEPYSRMHFSGDAVVEWVEITDKVTGGNDRSELRDNIASWSVTLEGIEYDSRLLDNDNAVLCMARFRPGAGGDFSLWTSWSVYWIGFIREVSIDDDADRAYNWRATVESWSQYLDTTDATPTTYGRIDKAEMASVTVSSVIIDPYTEAGSVEYIGSPELTGEKIVDGDMSTLWVSEVAPVATYPGVAYGGYWRINEIYIRPAPGMPSGLQWIELVFSGTTDTTFGYLNHYSVCNQDTLWKLYDTSCPPEDPDCGPKYAAAYAYFLGGFPEINVNDGEFVILTSNKPAFLEHWGETGAVAVLDWRHYERGGTFSLYPAGGKLGLKPFTMGTGDDVFWGNQTQDKWYELSYGGDTWEADNTWTGSNLPAMDDTECPAGYSYHRYPDAAHTGPDSRDDFELRPSTPKYSEPAPTPGAQAKSSSPEWAAIDMGEMGITLEEALSGSGGTEYVLVSSTLGLTNSGRIVVDIEYIDYTDRDDTTNKLTGITRGAGGTSQAAHPVDTPIYQREDGVTYACYLIDDVGWRRKNAIGTTPSVPRHFEIFFSTLASPILRDDEDWDDYWEDYWDPGQVIREADYSANGQQSVYYHKTIGPLRARWVMIVIHEMTDQGRAKLNEAHIFVPEQSETGDMSWSGEVVQNLLVSQFGIPPLQFNLDDRGTAFPGLSTTQQPYTAILNDWLKRTSCIVAFGRDANVYHRYDPRFPIGDWPSIEIEWNVDNATRVEVTRPYRHACKQVILRAFEPTINENYEVTYPQTALRLGTIEQVEDQVAGSLDQAVLRAQILFMRKNGLLTASVSPVGLGEWIEAGQRHTITWTLDLQNTYLQGRNFLVTGVQRAWRFGDRDSPPAWSCAIDLEELVF